MYTLKSVAFIFLPIRQEVNPSRSTLLNAALAAFFSISYMLTVFVRTLLIIDLKYLMPLFFCCLTLVQFDLDQA